MAYVDSAKEKVENFYNYVLHIWFNYVWFYTFEKKMKSKKVWKENKNVKYGRKSSKQKGGTLRIMSGTKLENIQPVNALNIRDFDMSKIYVSFNE